LERVGRWLVVLVVAVFALVLGACGGGEEVSDSDIVDAAGLEEGTNGAAYTVGGDPFCEVDELLNDSDEVEAADESKSGLVIANSAQDAGITGVPPFDPECAKRARRGLDSLE
jgi:hypothetical protein